MVPTPGHIPPRCRRGGDLADVPGIAAFVNLFPRELVTESASRMLIYALMPVSYTHLTLPTNREV